MSERPAEVSARAEGAEGEERAEGAAIPGERLHVPIDRRELYLPAWIVLGLWGLAALVLLWRALEGGRAEVAAFAWLGLGGAGALAGALRAVRRTERTTFTREGVWRPGWLGGGRFWRWAEVETVDVVRGGHGAITHLRLHARGRRMRIRVGAYRSPAKLARLVERSVGGRVEEALPAEDPE